jgi:hypothetical protein
MQASRDLHSTALSRASGVARLDPETPSHADTASSLSLSFSLHSANFPLRRATLTRLNLLGRIGELDLLAVHSVDDLAPEFPQFISPKLARHLLIIFNCAAPCLKGLQILTAELADARLAVLRRKGAMPNATVRWP